jgi:toxin ParE1/3/4
MKYEFHPAALQEYAEAVEFFAQQLCKNTRRLWSFLPSKTNNRISSTPLRVPYFRLLERQSVEGQVRRYLTLKFSYAVLYRVYPDRIVIAAIMSCRRDPNYWQERI